MCTCLWIYFFACISSPQHFPFDFQCLSYTFDKVLFDRNYHGVQTRLRCVLAETIIPSLLILSFFPVSFLPASPRSFTIFKSSIGCLVRLLNTILIL